MGAIGRFFRWLFIDPVRETLQAVTVILLASFAVATWFLTLDQVSRKPSSHRERDSADRHPL